MKAPYITFTRFCKEVIKLGLTDAQRVYCLVVVDNIEPEQLDAADRDIARVIFGNVERIAKKARRTALGVFGRGSGKDELGGAYCLWRMLTCDCSNIGVGDLPTAVILAPDKQLSTIMLRRAIARARSVPSISVLIQRETADGFELRRPDGHVVALSVLAASHAGSSVRGRSIVCGLMTEVAFIRTGEAAVSDAEIYNAMRPRLMTGGMILLFSTPWAESGLLWEFYEKNYGHPVDAIVGQASSLVMRPDDPDLAERVAIEEERDPVNAQREYGAQFVGIGSSSFFNAETIDEAVDTALPVVIPWDGGRRTVGWDLAFERDSSAIVVTLFNDELATIACTHEMRPTHGSLQPSEVLRQFAKIQMAYDTYDFWADQHNASTVRENAWAHHKLRLNVAPSHEKLQRHQNARLMFDEHRVRMPKNPRLVQQFKDVVSKPLPGGGVRIYTPRRVGNAHGDVASAAILTLDRVKVVTEQASRGAEARRRNEQKLNFVANQVVMLESKADSYEYKEAARRINEQLYREDANLSVYARIAKANGWTGDGTK